MPHIFCPFYSEQYKIEAGCFEGCVCVFSSTMLINDYILEEGRLTMGPGGPWGPGGPGGPMICMSKK